MGTQRDRLPAFNEHGLLPQGDHYLTLATLADSMLVHGSGDLREYPNWDAEWRARLVANLGILVRQLWLVGITEIFVDGSFVEDKDHPNDIDGYFECERGRLTSGELERELNRLDAHQIWTWEWDRRWKARGYSKPQLPMWHVYRVELFPHNGQLCGIRDVYGHELEFPSAFRQSRRGYMPRGILKLRKA